MWFAVLDGSVKKDDVRIEWNCVLCVNLNSFKGFHFIIIFDLHSIEANNNNNTANSARWKCWWCKAGYIVVGLLEYYHQIDKHDEMSKLLVDVEYPVKSNLSKISIQLESCSNSNTEPLKSARPCSILSIACEVYLEECQAFSLWFMASDSLYSTYIIAPRCYRV